MTTDRKIADRTADHWEAVASALSRAAVAWEKVSPDDSEPVCELRDAAFWNVAYWRERGRGLDNQEAVRETRRFLGNPAGRYINYDGEQGSQ